MKNKSILFLVLFFLTLHVNGQQAVRRDTVPFSEIHNSTVLFTFGQSNSASHGQIQYPYTAQHQVYNYFKGRLYKAKDPLLGTTGKGGSVWGIVGDKLIEAGMCPSVTIVPIGVGGVTVGAWSKGGNLYQRLIDVVDELVARKVRIDAICWHQGESDNIANTPTEVYVERFLTIREVFRSRGVEAPIFVAVASYHPLCLEEDRGCSKAIRKAQKELASRYDDIFEGPDTDRLNRCYQRADGIHFSRVGQQQHAALWVRALKKGLR